MPNPKSGTVSTDPEKTKKELEEGLVEYKTDSYGIIHQVIGKTSSDVKNLEENFRALLSVLPKEKISSAHIKSTMSPSVKVLTK
jgi:large subunit ribosomal protein L1